jgi:hypothetical protein
MVNSLNTLLSSTSTPLGVFTSNTIALYFNSGTGILSGNAICVPPTSLTTNQGAIGQNASGLFVQLGTTANTAAPGNIIAQLLSGTSAIANAVNAAGSTPTGAEFNALVNTVNQILVVLRDLGLPH